MNNARARHFHNLEQHVSSMIAQIEFGGTTNGESTNTRSCSSEQGPGAISTPKVEEYSSSNTYLVTPDGGYRCTYPGCAVKAVFSSKARFEYAYYYLFPV